MLYTFCRNNELQEGVSAGDAGFMAWKTHTSYLELFALDKISIVCNQFLAFRYLMRVHKKVIAYHLALPPVEPVDISMLEYCRWQF